jgi:hypothetical protein
MASAKQPEAKTPEALIKEIEGYLQSGINAPRPLLEEVKRTLESLAKPKIVVYLDGGLLQEVISNVEMDFVLLDGDIEGSSALVVETPKEWGVASYVVMQEGDPKIDAEYVGQVFDFHAEELKKEAAEVASKRKTGRRPSAGR